MATERAPKVSEISLASPATQANHPNPRPPVYPLPRPDKDDRFTLGLALDVAEVLERHGYPRPTGVDIVEIQLALFRFIYSPATVEATP